MISGTVSALINLVINMMVVFVFGLINGVNISYDALLTVPLLMELYILALAIAFSCCTQRKISRHWVSMGDFSPSCLLCDSSAVPTTDGNETSSSCGKLADD